jgi:hypothetical protein
MSVNDTQVRRLVVWNRLWLGLFIAVLLGWAGVLWINHFIENHVRAIRVYWMDDGGIKLSSSSDGPFVVTHLAKVATSEQEKSVVRLSPPIVIVDSFGAIISKSEFDGLKWHGYMGDAHPPPAVGTAIQAFYYKPLVTKSSSAQ